MNFNKATIIIPNITENMIKCQIVILLALEEKILNRINISLITIATVLTIPIINVKIICKITSPKVGISLFVFSDLNYFLRV